METDTTTIPKQAMHAIAAGVLSEEQARQIVAIGPEAAVFVILELSKQLAEHRADRCPDCGGKLKRCRETRTRYTEDIPEVQPEVTEHTIHRDWCPKCKKQVEPTVPDALPGSTLGNRVLVLSAWLHYSLGNTLSQIVEVFNFHLQLKLTPGGLVQMWYRLQAILYAWYEQIQQQALRSAVLHADESGWRVDGKTHWLWCFTTRDLTYYMIDRSRGSPALRKFFIEEFAGTLVTDFWGSYNAVVTVHFPSQPKNSYFLAR